MEFTLFATVGQYTPLRGLGTDEWCVLITSGSDGGGGGGGGGGTN